MKGRWMISVGLVALALAACGSQPSGDTAMSANDHAGMQHASGQSSGVPYDAQFIDGMTVHHQGAVAMAEQAL